MRLSLGKAPGKGRGVCRVAQAALSLHLVANRQPIGNRNTCSAQVIVDRGDNVLDFFRHLFDTEGFPARWTCGRAWSENEGLGWLHILSDLGVWAAYFAIPCILGYFVLRRRDVPFRAIFWLFGAFILACGTTHLMEAIIFWWPVYRLAGVIKLLTALVSWATIVALVPVVPRALAMRSPEELEREIQQRERAEKELRHMHAELEQRVFQRTADLASANEALQAEIQQRRRVEEAL